MRCGDLHLRIQDILETSFRFDADTNNTKLRTVLASRNTQRQEEQVILSTIRRQSTESLPQAGNDQTTNIRKCACKNFSNVEIFCICTKSKTCFQYVLNPKMEIPTTHDILLFRLMLCAIVWLFGATYAITLFID